MTFTQRSACISRVGRHFLGEVVVALSKEEVSSV
jgi:hypothetical protein